MAVFHHAVLGCSPLQSSLQLVALDGVLVVQAEVGTVEPLVRQAAVGRVVLWEAQQRAPHKHPGNTPNWKP